VVPVISDKIQKLDRTELTAIFETFHVLRPYGIAQEDIAPALDALQSYTPINMNMASTKSIDTAMKALGSGMKNITCSSMPELDTSTTTVAPIVVIVDQADTEACAAARVLKMSLQRSLQNTVQLTLQMEPATYAAALKGAWVCVAIITPQALQSAQFLSFLSLVKTPADMVPCIIGESYPFPDEAYYRKLSQGRVPEVTNATLSNSIGELATAKIASDALRQVFKSIAFFVNVPYASQQLLDVTIAKLTGAVQSKMSKKVIVDRRAPLEASDLLDQLPKQSQVTPEVVSGLKADEIECFV
jgi:hypothetical protein